MCVVFISVPFRDIISYLDQPVLLLFISDKFNLNLFPDHCVHLYDLRNVSKAVNVFRGHRKAVSYVKYCNEREVVSA